MTRPSPARNVSQSVTPRLSVIPRLLAIGGILAAFALRLYRLGTESLWYDETVSVFLAQQDVPELIAHTARDIHPPGYYLLLHLWSGLSQPTQSIDSTGLEFLYAWPSLFWGLLLIPMVYVLGRRIFSPRVALVALWLTAVNPFHIWYSQEVRMYTLGALLGLLCLWAANGRWQLVVDTPVVQPFVQPSRFHIQDSIVLYTLAAAAGLYTLYYFALLLVALNLLILWRFVFWRQPPARSSLSSWLLANGAVLVLWLPWLPTFWRQMINPPVPPWRSTLDWAATLQESLAALIVGQSPPLEEPRLWATVTALLLGVGFFVAWQRQKQVTPPDTGHRAAWRLIPYIFLPLFLIVAISLTLTPLYHIRYFFTYAAAGTLLVAFAIEEIAAPSRWLHAILLAGLFTASGWSLHEFWTNPLYTADDHRAAVTNMAAAWRPGDAVLVNAGWTYTALTTYWPTTPSPSGSQPAEVPTRTRLSNAAHNTPPPGAISEEPLIFLGGSVDGMQNLGWGLAESDFYAISADDTQAMLDTIATDYRRIWHYRLYDTVSDPTGVIRHWLDATTTQRLDLPYPGRDYLRVQLYETPLFSNPVNCPQTPGMAVSFGDSLVLRSAYYTPAPRAGSALYATLCWDTKDGASNESLRTSLRLYRRMNEEPVLIAQQDEAPFRPSTTTGNKQQTDLALPLPGNTPGGTYRLEVIVYDGMTGEPLPIDDPQAIVGQRWPLAESIEIGEMEK